MTDPKDSGMPSVEPLSVACPRCHVPPGYRCISPRGVRVPPHRQRVEAVPSMSVGFGCVIEEPRR